MKVDSFVPTNQAMAHARRAPRILRLRFAAVLLAAASVTAVAANASPGTAQEKPVAPEVATPLTLPDGTPDPAAQAALTDTLTLAPADSPPSPDDPFVAPLAARATEKAAKVVVFEATVRSNEANTITVGAAERAQRAEAAEVAARRTRDRWKRQLAVERKRLSNLSIQAYVTGGDFELLAQQAMLDGDTTDPLAGRMIMFEQVIGHQNDVTEQAIADLAKAEATLRGAIEASDVADAALVDASAIAKRLDDERLAAIAAHDRTVAEFDQAVNRLRNAPRGRPAPLEVPLIGMPRLSAEDLASWFAASPYRSKIATPIDDIAAWFIEEGRIEGIRGDVAFVQAVLETGGFTNGDSVARHNYSGIGHYDNLAAGWAFPSARDGVRAQIQLLKSYAVRQPNYAQPLVDRRLRGPAGCCRTWGDLTARWATDPTYGPKVMLLYSSLVDHAIGRRAAGEGLDFP